MAFYTRVFVIFLCSFFAFSSKAQSLIGSEQAVSIVKKIMKAYHTDGLLHLSIYTNLYASNQPAIKVDSMYGAYYIQGTNVLANLDNATTYLQNKKWSVSLFTEAKEMYVDTASEVEKVNLRGNPLQLIDTLALDSTNTYYYQDFGNDSALFKTVFPPGGELNQAILFLKPSTGRITTAEYKLPYFDAIQTGHSDTSATSINPPQEYIMKMKFAEAWSDEPSASIFNEKQYFIYNGNSIVPTERFKHYRIVTGFELPGNIN